MIHSAAFRRLVGKTQLFPGVESDFFRNRLTHSIEVAQIAKSIAIKLNHEEEALRPRENKIDTDLVETAALAHDLGHPPFGHNGEAALDELMREWGGFEGNAQTLRLLSTIEKKTHSAGNDFGVTLRGTDKRHGLNLTARTLAAVLKYDNAIPESRPKHECKGPVKGYYASDHDVVAWTKDRVLRGYAQPRQFKTVECQIMDIADDIAYSTYDLEDSFQAGFLDPVKMVAAKDALLAAVRDEIREKSKFKKISIGRIRGLLISTFFTLLDDQNLQGVLERSSGEDATELIEHFLQRYQSARDLADNGYFRTEFTSGLVGDFIGGVRFQANGRCLPLSKVYLADDVAEVVEVLKRFAYVSLIMSPRLKIAERRGKEIVSEIFNRLTRDDGYRLLPDDYRAWYERFKSDLPAQRRVICDFVAGMTDRYAVEFYSRLKSETPQTIFKPI